MTETKVSEMSATKFIVLLILGMIIASLALAAINKAIGQRRIQP